MGFCITVPEINDFPCAEVWCNIENEKEALAAAEVALGYTAWNVACTIKELGPEFFAEIGLPVGHVSIRPKTSE